MVRSKTRNLLANIYMAVKVSKFSSPLTHPPVPFHVTSLTLLKFNQLILHLTLTTSNVLSAIVDFSSTGATYQGLWAHLQQPLATTTGNYNSKHTVSI